MAIKYDVYPTPSNDENEETTYHVRLVKPTVFSTDRLAEEIEFGTSMTKGDVLSVFSSMETLFERHLLMGERIYINGIGSFKLSITAPTVTNPKDMRADHIKVRTILFTPENKLLAKLKDAEFEKARYNIRSLPITMDEIKALLINYFQENKYITRAQFQKLCHLTRTTAQNRINALIKEGVLEAGGDETLHFYIPVEKSIIENESDEKNPSDL